MIWKDKCKEKFIKFIIWIVIINIYLIFNGDRCIGIGSNDSYGFINKFWVKYMNCIKIFLFIYFWVWIFVVI